MERDSKRARTETRVTSIYDLPDEVVVQFFVDLDLPNLCRAAQVNRQWNDLVKHVVMPSMPNHDLLKEILLSGYPLENLCHSSKHARHSIFLSESPFTDEELAMQNGEYSSFQPKITTGFEIDVVNGVYDPYSMMYVNEKGECRKLIQEGRGAPAYQILRHIADGPTSRKLRPMYVATWFDGAINELNLMQSPDERRDMCIAAMRYARESLYGDVFVGMEVYSKGYFCLYSSFFIAYRPDAVYVEWCDFPVGCNTPLIRSAALYEALTNSALHSLYKRRRFILPNDDVFDGKVVELLRVWVSELVECANAQNWRITFGMSLVRLSTMKTVRCRPFES